MPLTRTHVGSPRSTGGAAIAVAMGVMNISTYAFTLVAARLLGPQAYGAFSAVLGVLLVVGVAQLGLQATAARRISAAPADAALVAPTVLRLTHRSALVLGGVLLLLSPVLDRALRLGSLPTAALIGVCAVPITVMGGQAGVLQGERRWRALAAVYLASGVPRLVLGVVLLVWRPTETVAVLAVTLGFVAAVAVGSWHVRDHRGADASLAHAAGHGLRRTLSEALHNSHALLAFFALTNVDIVVARNVLEPRDAGLYAAGLILVKAVLFLPQFVVVLAFPAMASDPRRRRALLLSTGTVVLVGALVVLGTWLLQGLAVDFVGGSAYAAVGPELWRWALLGTLASTLQLLVYGVVARQSRWTVVLLWAGLVVLLALAPLADSVVGLVGVVSVVDAVLVVLLLGLSLRATVSRAIR
ncbi:hypothetical protein GCM10011519_02160 [Marmoricola endophyticus]|uniref:Polysaccharide biosynthesis protein n=1 Tax=Marmoricola endophyticus TaxID=2040280 RepID=A0A917EYI6_9ACTN|nr:polysaccharide biosynthesis protein [Marmoricola endophyticus]GGF32333.1 hypothetical protein GCM10011519_02160 [Marmoricola endophyticus]